MKEKILTIQEATPEQLLLYSYDEIVEHLKEKYGHITKCYFTESGKKTSGITRGKDGLYLHHIDEDKMILLSNSFDKHPILNSKLLTKEQVDMIKIDFQKGDRLVYCNLLEHLILHIKIIEYPKPIIPRIAVGVGGAINFFIPELNDIYSGIQYKAEWKKEVVKQVIDFKSDYLNILKYLFNMIGDDIFRFKSFPMNSSLWDKENNNELYEEIINHVKKT